MGKKLSEVSSKISKNHQKQQFSSMIKALRPKVYITHSSRFKKLVQELTGNNITVTTMPSSSSSIFPTPEPTQNDVQITDSLETSFDSSEVSASPSSSEETTSTTTTTTTTITTSYSPSSEFCCFSNNHTCLNETILGSSETDQCMMDHHLLAYRNLESQLFDAEVEQSFLYDCYEQTEQEVSIYECELWELL